MRTTAPQSWADAWAIYQPILDSLASFHGKGLAHGKLSLACFEFNDSGTLTDGCLERLHAQATAPSMAEGGPYAAPECSLGTPVDEARVDVYSLGVILYELLCGRLPWPESADAEAIQALKAASKLPNPKRFQSEIPLDVLKVLRAATSGAPQRRPQSAVVMRALLGSPGHSVTDQPGLSPRSADPEPQPAQNSSTAAPSEEAPARLGQLPTAVTPAAHRTEQKQSLDEAPTAVLPATKRPAPGSVPPDHDSASSPSIGDATTTVIQGVDRTEPSSHRLESAETARGASAPLQSTAELAAGAVTTLHPAALRSDSSSAAESSPSPTNQLEDIRSLLDAKGAEESTEVLAFSEDLTDDGNSLRTADVSESDPQADSSTPNRRRRKKRRATPKESRSSGRLVLGLTLGLGILVLGGLSIGLMKFRSLAEGPNSAQTRELLGLSKAPAQDPANSRSGKTHSQASKPVEDELGGEEPSPEIEANGELAPSDEGSSSLAQDAERTEDDTEDSDRGRRSRGQDKANSAARIQTASSPASQRTPTAPPSRRSR